MMDNQVIIVRPYYGNQFSLKWVRPGYIETHWCVKETIESVNSICRKCNVKILYISTSMISGVGEPEEIYEPESDLIWEPSLSREEAREVFSSEDNYCKWLSGGISPAVPKSINELEEYGVRFGGKIHLAPSIQRKLELNEELLFINYRGFELLIPHDLALEYIKPWSSTDMNEWLIDLFHLLNQQQVRKVVMTFKDGTKGYFTVISNAEFQYGRDGDVPTNVIVD